MSSSARRRSTRLRDGLENTCFPTELSITAGAQCGACLLDIEADAAVPLGNGIDGDVERFAILDCCDPTHWFHINCIFTWTQQENSCPQCKKRFSNIGVYGSNNGQSSGANARPAQLLRVAHAIERDQDFDETDAEASDDDAICEICCLATDEASLLLCDGFGGTCNAACHYYCAGLPEVPEGDWFCRACAMETSNSTTLSSGPQDSQDQGGTCARVATELASMSVRADESEESQDPEEASASTAPDNKEVRAKPDLAEVTKKGSGIVRSPRALGAEQSKEQPPVQRRRGTKVEEKKHVKIPNEIVAHSTSHKNSSSRGGGGVASSSGLARQRVAAKAQTVRPAGPEVFGGLCKETPKWISRRGDLLRVDLGGRDMRDPAAKVLAQVVGAALTHVAAAQQTSSGTLKVSFLLAGNRLRQPGIAAFLDAATSAGFHVVRLELERNDLDRKAASWLGNWCARQPKGPPSELYLSQNRIGDDGVAAFLFALGRSCFFLQEKNDNTIDHASHAVSGRLLPIWVEVFENRVHDASSLLDRLTLEVPICLAADRSACSPCSCTSTEEPPPRLHLHRFLDQSELSSDSDEQQQGPLSKNRDASDMNTSACNYALKAEPGQLRRNVVVKSEPREAIPMSASKDVKSDRDCVVPNSDGLSTARRWRCELAASRAEARAADARLRGIGSSPALQHGHQSNVKLPHNGSSVENPAPPTKAVPQNVQRKNEPMDLDPDEPSTVPASQSRASEGDHSYRSRGRGRGVQPSLTNEVAAGSVEFDAEAHERKSWAKSLGKQCYTSPSLALSLRDDAPPSYGLWDLVRRPLTPQQRKKRRVEKANAVTQNISSPADSTHSKVAQTVNASQVASHSASAYAESPSETILVAQPEVPTVTMPLQGKLEYDAALEEFVSKQLTRHGRLLREGLDPTTSRLRRRCFKDRLCRLAHAKYSEVVLASANSWRQYLSRSSGRQRLAQWVDKKVRETLAKE